MQDKPLSEIIAGLCAQWALDGAEKHAFRNDVSGKYVVEAVRLLPCTISLCLNDGAEQAGAEGRRCAQTGGVTGLYRIVHLIAILFISDNVELISMLSFQSELASQLLQSLNSRGNPNARREALRSIKNETEVSYVGESLRCV